MASVRITTAELLDELARSISGTTPAEAQTTRELMENTGWSEYKVNQALRMMHDQGRLVTHRVSRMARDGVLRPTAGYTLKSDE